jgi:hypothetical protein
MMLFLICPSNHRIIFKYSLHSEVSKLLAFPNKNKLIVGYHLGSGVEVYDMSMLVFKEKKDKCVQTEDLKLVSFEEVISSIKFNGVKLQVLKKRENEETVFINHENLGNKSNLKALKQGSLINTNDFNEEMIIEEIPALNQMQKYEYLLQVSLT